MTATSIPTESEPSGRRCAVCRGFNPPGSAACRHCLAALTENGVVAGLERPRDLRGPLWGGSLFASVALVAGLSAVPNSPVRVLHQRLFPPPPPPRVIAVPVTRGPELAKFEPATGCLLGAFVMKDINISGRMERWEQITGKGHASYLRYVGYRSPSQAPPKGWSPLEFPKEWVAEVRKVGAVPNLALEPNGGLSQVQDDQHLRRFARAAAESGGPVFLRFASEMNGPWTKYHGDPAAYRSKFRLVARVMREEAPNVAMVWTPYCTPQRPIPDYYPGDDAVDWVGVNIYSVHHHDGVLHRPAHHEDPAELLQPVYDLYADRKPIQISEYAATHYCKACDGYVADFAMNKMIHMYRSLPQRFPRVKMIYWFSWDTVSGKAAENNYAVTDDPVICDTYRRLIAPDYFLSRLPRGEYWDYQPAPPMRETSSL